MIGYIAVVVVASVAIFVAGSLYGKSAEQKAVAELVRLERVDCAMAALRRAKFVDSAYVKIKARVLKYL